MIISWSLHSRALGPLAIVASLGIALSAARAQKAVADSATDYIVRVTQRWGAFSPIGELRMCSMDADDVELRVWGGYGLGGTRGVILRRTDGRWQAWRAQVVECVINLATTTWGETSPTDSMRMAEARRQCPRFPDGSGAYHSVDTLALESLDARRAGSVWDGAVRAGVLGLPPKLPGNRIMIDGFGIVIEVRRGDVYRASTFHAVRPPEVAADSAAREIYRTVINEFAPIRKG
jgi:hypothetical protein